MAPKGWFNLEAGGTASTMANVLPENQYFEGDSAFKFLGLTRTQRLYGFAGCAIAGFVLSLLGTIMLFVGGLALFATLYAIGTILSLVATGFLIGFRNQLKMMFKPVRVIATVVLLLAIVAIFLVSFILHSGALAIIFVVIQYVAYIWYSLSYIPYARTAILKMVGMGG